MVTSPVKLVMVFPWGSCVVTWTAGAIAAPATALLGCMVNTSCVPASATRKSGSDSALPPNETQALAPPDSSTVRACQ